MENLKIFLDEEISTKSELFEFIASKAKSLKFIKDKLRLIKGFMEREEESSTAFEDGFAIPHTLVQELKEPAIIVVRSTQAIEWESMDNKPTRFVIALLVPQASAEEHLEILSRVATQLTSSEIKNKLINANNEQEIREILTQKKSRKKHQQKKSLSGPKVVAVTACVVGVAHTYMAEEKLLKELSACGIDIRVETQGSKGIGNQLTVNEIAAAELVIIATDTNIDKTRFNGKMVYQTHVARAIKEPLKVYEDARTQAVLLNTGSEFKTQNTEKQGLIKHILAGISYMIPIIIAGGVLIAASLGIAKAIWGAEASTTGLNGEYPHNPLWAMEQIGGTAFTLMIPILAAFIANSIGGRAAIAPALVGGFIGNDANKFVPMFGMKEVATPMGFIGAIIAGILVGYFTSWVNTWRVPKSLRAAMPIFFIPIVGSIGISVLFMYVLGGPIGFVMDKISIVIKDGYSSDQFGIGLGLGLGLIIGCMAGFDMGGPINKIAFVTSSALITQNIYYPMGAMAAAIPVAPLGMGLSAVLFKRFFSREEKAAGISALIMGMIGISEGAIPFAIRDPKRAIACNVLGSGIAGAIAGALRIEDFAAHGGPIVAILGAVPYGLQTMYFFLAVGIGTAVCVVVYGLWLVATLGKFGSVKEAFVSTIEANNLAIQGRINSLKQEIAVLKTQLKQSQSEAKANELKTKISNLQAAIIPIKVELKNLNKNAKAAYKQIAGLEKTGIKNKILDFKKFLIDEKQNKSLQLKAIHTDYLADMQNADKYVKRKIKEDYINNKEEVITTYTSKISDFEIKMRKEYVDQFKALI